MQQLLDNKLNLEGKVILSTKWSATEIFLKIMAGEHAIRAIRALECLSKLMDLYDEFDKEEEQKVKKRKTYVKSEDVETQILKDIAWKNNNNEDSFCPLTMENFEELYHMISSKIDKNDLVLPSISLRMRLAITLRYLIAGESHRILESISHISRKYITKIIPEMLKNLIPILEKKYLRLPTTQSEWTRASKDFETYWDFPHTLGVLDARNFRVKTTHIEMPSKNLILISVLDAHSRFQHIELIRSEEQKYSTAYINSRLYKSLATNAINIPSEKQLKGQTEKTAYFFVGNEIFRTDRYILSTYDQTSAITRSEMAFNFRLNRVRIPVQMAFEIMFFRFKIFYRLNDINIDKAKIIIKICCLLHNYLTQKLTHPLEHEDLTKLELPGSDVPLPKQISESYESDSKTRKNVCKYFVGEGNIPEQWQNI